MIEWCACGSCGNSLKNCGASYREEMQIVRYGNGVGVNCLGCEASAFIPASDVKGTEVTIYKDGSWEWGDCRG